MKSLGTWMYQELNLGDGLLFGAGAGYGAKPWGKDLEVFGLCNRSEGWERISTPPGHVISQGSAPGARVVTCRGGGGNSPQIHVLYIRIHVLYIKIHVLYIKIHVFYIKIHVFYIKKCPKVETKSACGRRQGPR